MGNVPAVPIITMPYLGIYGLAQMVKYKENICQVCLIPKDITDTPESKVPLGLSWALDVEDGARTIGKIFDVAEEEILKAGRLPLTVVGILSLGRGGVLSSHNVIATGSHSVAGEVADVWLDDGKPELYWLGSGDSHAKWGSASCGRYIEL